VTVGIGVPPVAGGGPAALRFAAGPGVRAGVLGRLGHAAGEVVVEALRRAGRGLTGDRLADALGGAESFVPGSLPPLVLIHGRVDAAARIWRLQVHATGRATVVPADTPALGG
jgi:hypothetical protein